MSDVSKIKAEYQRFYFPYNRKYYPYMEDLKTEAIEVDVSQWSIGNYITEHSDGVLGNQGNLIFEGDVLKMGPDNLVVHYHDKLGTFVIFDDMEWLNQDVIDAAKSHPQSARRVEPKPLKEVINMPVEFYKTTSVHLVLFYCNINPRVDKDFTKWRNVPLRPIDAWLYFHPDKALVYPLIEGLQHGE